jgi:hypothetical protein
LVLIPVNKEESTGAGLIGWRNFMVSTWHGNHPDLAQIATATSKSE